MVWVADKVAFQDLTLLVSLSIGLKTLHILVHIYAADNSSDVLCGVYKSSRTQLFYYTHCRNVNVMDLL